MLEAEDITNAKSLLGWRNSKGAPWDWSSIRVTAKGKWGDPKRRAGVTGLPGHCQDFGFKSR